MSMQMGKIPSQGQLNRTSESVFLLKRSDNSSTNVSIEVKFPPVTLNSQPNPLNQQSLDVQNEFVKSYPIFNFDRRFFTPSFILEVDKVRYTENEQIYYSLHQKKKEEICQEKHQIYVPKPSKNCSFCCICRVLFDDYLTHVTNPIHKKNISNSEFTKQINEMCKKIKLQSENQHSASMLKKVTLKEKKITKTCLKIEKQQKKTQSKRATRKAQKK